MAKLLTLAWVFFISSLVGATSSQRDLNKLYSQARFKVGSASFTAYVADTEQGRSDGLMYVTHLPENTGMLFVFDGEQPLAFWMKNTLIPLAIAFADDKGVIVDIQEMSPQMSMVSTEVPTYRSQKPATFALEMNKGWFARNKVKVGDRILLVSESKSKILSAKLKSHSRAGH